MHIVTVEFEVAKGCEEQFLARMEQQARDSLEKEEDCLHFDVCVAPDDPGRVFLYEIYRDPAAFQAHLDSAHFEDFSRDVESWLESRSIREWRQVF